MDSRMFLDCAVLEGFPENSVAQPQSSSIFVVAAAAVVVVVEVVVRQECFGIIRGGANNDATGTTERAKPVSKLIAAPCDNFIVMDAVVAR